MFSTFLLTEAIAPKKPSGGVRKKKVVKNRGMITQKNLDQIEFDTKSGNNVKVQFQIRDGVGDIVFYVNDTLDDLGGRSDGSVDPEILSGVLWVVDVYADRLGLSGLTFNAWAGAGDTKIVRGLDVGKPREVALRGIERYMDMVRAYEPVEIPPSESRIALAAKMGREVVKVYDVNVGKLLEILGKMHSSVESGSYVDMHDFEEMLWWNDKSLDKKIPGGWEVKDLVGKYRVALLSNSKEGASVVRNRRLDLYKRLMDKFFSVKWNIKQERDSFDLTRKSDTLGESVVVERKSLDEKSKYIQSWAEEAMELLRSGRYFLCHGLKMSFGKFYGVKCVGVYGPWGFRNVYYLGRVDDRGEWNSATAQGRADIVDAPGMQGRESCVFVTSGQMYELATEAWNEHDFGFSVPVGRLEGFDVEGAIFAVSDHDRQILYHELSHVYDMWKRGENGLGRGDYKWISRPEELEAEMNLLYNSIVANLDSYESVGDFEKQYPLTSAGLGKMSKDYDTQIGSFMTWAKNNPGKVGVEYKKIIRRLVDLRGQVIAKLSDRGDVTESVTIGRVRKFSDLMRKP